MTRNLTLRLDDDIMRKARHAAVENDQSLSQWVADLIAQALSKEQRFSAAKRRALKRLGSGFDLGGKPFSRDEIHAR